MSSTDRPGRSVDAAGAGEGGAAQEVTLTKREMTVFRPPIIRSGANALNRALFLKKVTIAAAAVNDNRNISKWRKGLSAARKLIYAERISPIASHPDKALAAQGRKCLLLDVGVKAEGEGAVACCPWI